MGRFADDRAEIRQVWRQHRDNLDVLAQIPLHYFNDRDFKKGYGGKGWGARVQDAGPFFGTVETKPCSINIENPTLIIRPRFEHWCLDYWKLRFEGLKHLLKADAACPGRFQTRLELAWERFRGRALPRHLYMQAVAEKVLNKKYDNEHDIGKYMQQRIWKVLDYQPPAKK